MDTDIFYRCHEIGARFLVIEQVLAAYRRHNKTKTLEGWKESIEYKRRFYGYWLSKVPEDEQRFYGEKIRAYFYSLYLRSIKPTDSIFIRLLKILYALFEYPSSIIQLYKVKRLWKLLSNRG